MKKVKTYPFYLYSSIDERIKNRLLVALLFLFYFNSGVTLFAQSVAFNTSGLPAHPSAILDISAANKGILFPRIALTGITDNTTISAPANSIIIYNTATTATVSPGFYYWSSVGSTWIRIVSGVGGGFSWSITGNGGTSASVNFIGTTDNVDFSLRTNNIERLRLESNKLRFMNNGSSVFMGNGAAAVDDLSSNYNVALGYQALAAATNAEYSVAIGYRAMYAYNISGGSSIAIGNSSQAAAASGTNNVSLGSSSLTAITSGSFNTTLGYGTGNSLTTGSSNTFVYSNMINGTATSNNVALGGLIRFTGTGNVGIGYQCMNTSSGTINRCVGIGLNANKCGASSEDNVALGAGAMGYSPSYTLGSTNVAVGKDAGGGNNGSGNVFLGAGAGYSVTGSNSLCIGTSTPLIRGNFSTDLLGVGRIPTANNFEIEGSASKASAGNWVANSDRRIKKDIQDIDNALETINQLRPVTFEYTEEWKSMHPSLKEKTPVYYNYIAQEYKKIFPHSVKGNGEYIKGDKKEILQIDTYNSQIVLVKAIQEQQLILLKQQKEIEEFNKQLQENNKTADQQQKELDELEAILKSMELPLSAKGADKK